MNVWLDDVRPCPDGYYHVKTAEDCIDLLCRARVNSIVIEHLSLDHDLGEDTDVVGTGYDVVLWLEEQVFTDESFNPPSLISVHSDNAGARKKMLMGLGSIERRLSARRGET